MPAATPRSRRPPVARSSDRRAKRDRIPTLDRQLVEGDEVKLGAHPGERARDAGPHRPGHIVYSLPDHHLAFVGDTLFALGCGRLFEGTPEQMWTSLQKLRALPDDTTIFCAHEYTAANAAFALSVDPENAALRCICRRGEGKARQEHADRADIMAAERPANPFLRADDPGLQTAMGHPGDAVATFAEIRERKNQFKA